MRKEIRDKKEFYSSQSVIKLMNESKQIDHGDYNKELMQGRYEIKLNKKFSGPNDVLKKIVTEEVAFYLYKNRNYITKAPILQIRKE